MQKIHLVKKKFLFEAHHWKRKLFLECQTILEAGQENSSKARHSTSSRMFVIRLPDLKFLLSSWAVFFSGAFWKPQEYNKMGVQIFSAHCLLSDYLFWMAEINRVSNIVDYFVLHLPS